MCRSVTFCIDVKPQAPDLQGITCYLLGTRCGCGPQLGLEKKLWFSHFHENFGEILIFRLREKFLNEN
jgi:hypothetical protein